MNVRRSINFVMVMAMLATSFAFSQPAVAAEPERTINPAPVKLDAPRAEGEIVVVYADASEKSLPALVAQAFETASENDAEVTRLTPDGSMVLKVDEGELLETLEELNNDPDVLYAEPNYTYSVPQPAGDGGDGYVLNSEYVLRNVEPSYANNYRSVMAVPISQLQAMKTRNGSTIQATYPNDPYTFQNGGWAAVGADIVWNNATASAGVCVVDTGVDAAHKDLANRLLAGYDFVHGDTIPQDDNGHGTHVTGILVANRNNKIGMVGVSTGKVVPVKALDAQGNGSTFDIAAAITYCANRSDVRVINLSFGSPTPSTSIQNAINTAVNSRNKLVVVAAGNDGMNLRGHDLLPPFDGNPDTFLPASFPAGYADKVLYPTFSNKVIAVAASGKQVGNELQYQCGAPYSNYGSWITVVAPGTDIYSTTPWDKSFYLNYFGGINTRFNYMSGTSMAAPFVAGAAARYLGYKPTDSNLAVGIALQSKGSAVSSAGGCWDASMDGKLMVNIAKLMDRGAMYAGAFDAYDGTPLVNATISAYQGATKRGSALLAPVVIPAPPDDIDPTRIYMYPNSYTDIINLPVLGAEYTARVNKAGYTVGDQLAYRHETGVTLVAGDWKTFGDAAVPPRSANFDIVLSWNIVQGGNANIVVEEGLDLDLDVYLPAWPNPDAPTSQLAPMIVGMQSDQHPAYLSGYGSAHAFPFARVKREGGYSDNTLVETITIRNRFAAHSPLAANVALPYYPNMYAIYVTDYGQTIDHDGDGCGDNYGRDYLTPYDPEENPSGYNPAADPDCPPNDGTGTLGIPLMGSYYRPYVYVWKDGVVKFFVTNATDNGLWGTGLVCNNHWWKALAINSGRSGTAPTYTEYPGGCDDGSGSDFFPYRYMLEEGLLSTGK